MSRVSYSNVVQVVPTLDTSAYASGDRLGSIQTIPFASRIEDGYGGLILHSIEILDQAKQSAAIDILFFNASPTVASADNAAIDITDAEMLAKFIGVVSISETYVALANSSVVSKTGISLILEPAAGVNAIYAVPVIRAAATYAAGSLKFHYGFLQD